MSKYIKRILMAFVFLQMLIFMLFITNLIPNKFVNKNLVKSITNYHDVGFTFYIKDVAVTIDDASADSTELQIMNNNDPKHLLYSVLVTPAYRTLENQDFIQMSYDNIVNHAEPNYDYNRYWHGYQILWKPLLIFCQANTIKLIYMIGYIILLGYLLFLLIKDKNTRVFGIGYALMHIFNIIPFGFTALEYIPIFYIMTIGCLLLYKTKIDIPVIFYCLGISAAFFDFWTAETLTFTAPILLFIVLYNSKYKDIIFNGLRWLVGYCFTFVYKWTLATIIFHENFFVKAYDKYKIHETSIYSRPSGIKFNVSILFNYKFANNEALMIFIIIILTLLLIYYLFRNTKSDLKTDLSILSIGLIPYLEYFVCNGHSSGFTQFTYRSQLILILVFTMIYSNIDLTLFRSKQIRRKK